VVVVEGGDPSFCDLSAPRRDVTMTRLVQRGRARVALARERELGARCVTHTRADLVAEELRRGRR